MTDTKKNELKPCEHGAIHPDSCRYYWEIIRGKKENKHCFYCDMNGHYLCPVASEMMSKQLNAKDKYIAELQDGIRHQAAHIDRLGDLECKYLKRISELESRETSAHYDAIHSENKFLRERIIELEKEVQEQYLLNGSREAKLLTRIAELEKAAEMEFQRAEGKNEMKRWFQKQLHAKDEAIRIMRDEFKTILHSDTRLPKNIALRTIARVDKILKEQK